MPRVSAGYRSARRELILAAAVRCFTARGISGTTMADIHREAGISVGGIYRYFPSKQEILLEVAQRDHAQLNGMLMRAVTACAHPNDVLRAVFLALGRYRDAYPVDVNRLAVASWLEAATNPPLRELINESFTSLSRAFAKQLTQWDVPHREHAALTHAIRVLIFGHIALSVLEKPA